MTATAQNARIDPALAQEIRDRAVLSQVIGRTVALKRSGRELVGLCPFHNEKSGSFTVRDDKQFYHCFGCGAHGDVIGFVMKHSGLSFPDAVESLAREYGLGDRVGPARPRTAEEEKARQEALERRRQERAAFEQRHRTREAQEQRAAAFTWSQRTSFWDSPAQFYMESRGLRLEILQRWWPRSNPALGFAPLLFHAESGRRLPAMLGPIVLEGEAGATGEGKRALIGLHRTFLAADGSGKADVEPNKKVQGNITGGAIRLAPAGEHLILAEGIETAASCMQALDLPAWAGVSLGNMAGPGDPEAAEDAPLHPTKFDRQSGRRVRLPTSVPDMKNERPGFGGIVLPPIVRRVTIAADNDSKDPDNARCLIERCAARYALMGLQVKIAWPPPGMDFNDVLQKGVA